MPGDRQAIERYRFTGSTTLKVKPSSKWRGGRQPFFSPDSAWLGFFTASELRKVSVRGGPAQTLATTPAPRGGTWGENGWIVFSPQPRAGPVASVGRRGHARVIDHA